MTTTYTTQSSTGQPIRPSPSRAPIITSIVLGALALTVSSVALSLFFVLSCPIALIVCLTAASITVASGTTAIALYFKAKVISESPSPQPIEIKPGLMIARVDEQEADKTPTQPTKINGLAESQIDINQIDGNNETPLTLAASLGDHKAVTALLAQGCKTAHKNSYDRTALMMAAHRGHVEVVKALLNHGVNITEKNDRGHTALILAVFEGHEEIVDLLSQALSPSELSMHKESLKLIMLGHSTHQEGKLQLNSREADAPTSTTLNVRGGGIAYSLKKMQKATQVISQHSNILTQKKAHLLNEFLETGTNLSNKDLLKRAEKGLPVLLSTGFNTHAVSVLIWGPYFILCNRGSATRSPIEVRTFNPKSLDESLLTKIQEEKYYLDINGYCNLFFNELPGLLQFNPQSAFERSLELACSLKNQHIGNCAWASPEAAVWAFLTLGSLLESVHQVMDDLPTLSYGHIRQCVHEKTEQFNGWLAMNQMYRVESYLGLRTLRKASDQKKADRLAERRRHFKKEDTFVRSSLNAIKRQCDSVTGPFANDVLSAFKNLELQISLL